MFEEVVSHEPVDLVVARIPTFQLRLLKMIVNIYVLFSHDFWFPSWQNDQTREEKKMPRRY